MGTEIRSAAEVRTFAAAVLERAGMPLADAEVVADALAWADLRDIPAQGLAKLPLIVERLRAGGSVARPTVRTVRRTASATVFDVDDEWGHVSGARAMRAAMADAKRAGAGLALVRSTSSASAMGYYAMLAVADGLIGVAINNGTPLMRPWGGTTTVLGNQAFAIGCPAGRHPPLLLDTAMSAITLTGIERLRERGEKVPEGAALDADGLPTTDPAAALAGILLPMGGHRGYALALLFEVLTGVLAGGTRIAGDITPIYDLSRPQGVSHLMLALDPTSWLTGDEYAERVDRLVDRVRATPAAPGATVRLPGDRAARIAAVREATGISYPDGMMARIRKLADDHGVPW